MVQHCSGGILPALEMLFQHTTKYLFLRPWQDLCWVSSICLSVDSFLSHPALCLGGLSWMDHINPLRYPLYQFSKAALAKHQRLDAFGNRNLFSHNSGDQKSKIKVLAVLVSSEVLLSLSCRWPSFPCLHVVFSLYMSVSKCPVFIKILVILDQGAPYSSYFNLIASLKTQYPYTDIF